jgi:SAM-dependent methyltransferase
MDYINSNKEAWEEAFDKRHEGWGNENYLRLLHEELPFLNEKFKHALLRLNLRGKTIAQFCCNNGREILSAMKLGAKAGVGFDIAENMVAQARETARKAGISCDFRACNILNITDEYREAFDLVFFTIGAITWFQDLQALFSVAAKCLKPGGALLIEESHPFINMLPLPGEEKFNPDTLDRIAYSYFREEPWIENKGMGYMTPDYNSKTFTSFSHTMACILNAIIASGMNIVSLQEFDFDIGMSDVYDGKGYPLSYILRAEKRITSAK